VPILRFLSVLLCASTLAFAASGCGGGGGTTYSGTSPEVWVATVCGALSDWAQGLQADSQALSAQLGNTRSLSTVKTKFVAFIAGAGTGADTMLAKVQAAGPPAVKEGTAIQRELEAGLRRARASFTRAEARAKRLSATDPQAFASGVQALGADVQKELTATGQAFDTLGTKYDDGTLNEATSKEPACSKISS